MCKRSGPVSGVLSWTTIYLGPPSPMASSEHTRASVGPTLAAPICSCSRWGLPSRHVAMTLVRSYRTVSAFLPSAEASGGVFFSVALSVGSRRPAVSWHPALWSPDFPHVPKGERAAVWPTPRGILSGDRIDTVKTSENAEKVLGRLGLVLLALCLNLGPCVLQRQRAVEDQRAGLGVEVSCEVADPLELHGLAARDLGE